MFLKKLIKLYFYNSDENIEEKKGEIRYDLSKGII